MTDEREPAEPDEHDDDPVIDLGVDLLGPRGLALVATVVVTVLLLAHVTHNAVATVLGTFLVGGIALDLLLRPVRIFLGREAVERRGLRTARMRYVDITNVALGRRAHTLHTQVLTVRTGSARWRFVGRGVETRAAAVVDLANRLEARLAAFRSHESPPTAPLARAQRDDATWTRDLRDLVAGERNGYRRAAVAPDVLLRIAENPTSSDEERIAALVALSPVRSRGSEPLVRARIAALAPETGTLDLREAVGAWLAEDDDALERALHASSAKR